MSPQLLSLLLYIPFVLVGVVTGVIFCLKGYKQGLWRALISLGISAVAIVLSVLFARLVGSLLSGVVFGFVPQESFAELGAVEGLASQFVTGLISDLLAILFFALILLILLIVFKVVGNHIKTEELQPESKGQRWGGVGVRALDALLVSLLLLLPLYGSIATYVSPVAQVSQKVSKVESAEMEYLNGLSENGLVSLYKVGPTAWVQGGLSGFTVGNVEVDLAEMASLLEGAVLRFERVSEAETEEETAKAIGDLSDFLREELIEEDFFYQMVHQLRAEAAKEVAKISDGEEKEMAEFFLDVANVTREEFEDNGSALLDFISYAVRPEIMGNLSEGNYSKLPAEFYSRFGALLNHSEQSVALKKYFLTSALAYELFIDLSDEMEWYSSSVHNYVSEMRDRAEQAAWDRAELFVANHWPTGMLTADLQMKEAEAFVIIFFDSNEANILEAVARLPYCGAQEAIKILSEEEHVLKELFYSEQIVSYIKANPESLQPLKKRLQDCETTPLTDSSNLFRRYVDLLAGKIVYPEGFDDAQWDQIVTNEMGKNDFASSDVATDSFGGGFAVMGDGESFDEEAQSGIVSVKIYLKEDESAPVDDLLKSLTEPQMKLLMIQGFLELEDGRVLICEKSEFSSGNSFTAPEGSASLERIPLG